MEIRLTSDGSHTLFIPEMDEHYHSVNGAIGESLHVFIRTGLNHCLKKEVQVLELGFGTGLNSFLTCLEAKKNDLIVHYTGLEKYPLTQELINQLNYTEILGDEAIYRQIHACQWNTKETITPYFSLNKIKTDFSDFDFAGPYDVVYYDAFAPDKQTTVWSLEIFEKIYRSMNENGILTTYCAKGNIRRMMMTAGFSVERIPGPPGKREMLRAVKGQN